VNTLQKDPPANNQGGKEAWQQKLMRSGYFLAAVLLHLIIFSLIATFVIFQAPKPETEASFGQVKSMPVKVPPPPAPPASGDTANNPTLEPDPVVVPVVTPPSAITSVNSSFTVNTTKAFTQAISHVPAALPQGTGLGHAGSGGGAGLGSSIYGSGSGSTQDLVGYLYDLKQTPDLKPTPIMDSAGAGLDFLRSFVKDWNMSSLDNYWKAPGTLYATQVFIPVRHSEEATKAFNVDTVVQAKRWIIVYDGKVTVPETGTYRFVGFADDFMVVRWDGTNVLDASYDGEVLDPSATDSSTEDSFDGRSYRFGTWIQMQAGAVVPIKILIGEGPGGYSGFLLMIQKQGDDSKKCDYPVFQLRDTPIPDMKNDFSKKKLIFPEAP